MGDNPYTTASSLIEILEHGQPSDFPPANKKKAYADRYKELDRYFSEFPVEMGGDEEGDRPVEREAYR